METNDERANCPKRKKFRNKAVVTEKDIQRIADRVEKICKDLELDTNGKDSTKGD